MRSVARTLCLPRERVNALRSVKRLEQIVGNANECGVRDFVASRSQICELSSG
jgi:hypothetical protein